MVSMVGCSAALTTAAAQCRNWNVLDLDFDDALEQVFNGGRVSAERLSIGTSAANGRAAAVEVPVGQCKGLKSLVCGWVDLLSLARGLDQNRSVQSVEAGLVAASLQDERDALAILERNTSITNFELRKWDLQWGPPPTTEWFNKQLAQRIARNRWRLPLQSSTELSKAFGWSMRAELRDAVGHMGPWLDHGDFLALSQTSKAAYIGSRRPWQIQVDRLADLFVLKDADRFKSDLVRQLKDIDPTFATPERTAPLAQWTVDTVSQKAAVMQSLGVPDIAIGQALDRAIKKDPAFMGIYLKVMQELGASRVDRWLQEMVGIDVRATGLQ